MGLQKHAHALAGRNPALARQIILDARIATISGFREQVYVFQGTYSFDRSIVHKVGRSRTPAERIKQVSSQVITIKDWYEIAQIVCCADRRMSPSPADTLEKLLHGLFRPYQILSDHGREFFSLPNSEIAFLSSLAVIDAIALNIAVLNAYHGGR